MSNGTGFVRIREALSLYPEIEFKVEEIGDFFMAVLRQIGSVTPPITPPNHPPQLPPQLPHPPSPILNDGY